MRTVLIFAIIFGLSQSCGDKVQIGSNTSKEWYDSTQLFIKQKCRSYQLLTDTFDVKFKYDNIVFKNTIDYIFYRLRFRADIEFAIDRIMSDMEFQKIRITEYYNSRTSKAIITIESRKKNNEAEAIINELNNDNISIKTTFSLERAADSENLCTIAAKHSMITKFTIITDLSRSGQYTTRLMSFY
ncbi:MAG: hypothetical protein IPN33_01335 [Saprospiraceae bacterium]|jgi:hypothetical protein|nr:hypothetical protein [Saprospiraceae bacterium]